MNEDFVICQKQNGNKETLRFISYLSKLIFPRKLLASRAFKSFFERVIFQTFKYNFHFRCTCNIS
eukprot:UN23212